jgi:Xaa-Pro aminopeptidase
MLGFEALTMAPIDRRLVDTALLTAEEIAQLDAYHARVLAVVGPGLDAAEKAWLEAACAAI